MSATHGSIMLSQAVFVNDVLRLIAEKHSTGNFYLNSFDTR